MLRKIRRNYRRLMAFVLSVTMMISNMSVNVGTAFAAEKKEELEIALFMLDGKEILDAVRNLENQEEFDLEDLELESAKKSVGKDYEELLHPEKGKVYELALTVDDEMAPEDTELLTLYRTETEEVVFLFVNESREAFDFCVNIDGYETKLVTVNANSVNVNDDEKATEGKAADGKAADGKAADGKAADKEATDKTDGEAQKADENKAAEDSGNEKYSGNSAKSSNSEHVDDSANGNDERISESEAQPEADEEEKESSENQDSTDKAEEGIDNRLEESSEKDAENTLEKDSDKNEAVSDEGKDEGKKTETEKSDSGKSDSEKSDSEKPNGEKADEVKNDNAASENKDSGKAESHESENKDAGKSGDDKVENSKSEGDKSENSKPESSVSENSKSEDSKSNDSKSDSKDSGKSNSEDSAGKELSISYHQAAFVAVPLEDIQGDNEELTESEQQEEVTEAVSEINPSDEEHKDSNSANVSERFEVAENEAETEKANEVKLEATTAQESAEETAEAETEEETTANETAAAETGEAAIEEEPKEETTTAETTAAETTTAETTTEAAENTAGTTKENLSAEKPSDSHKDDKEILDDEWEIPGKAYDGVTIWETARARAYCVELENVLKIMEFNGEEPIDDINLVHVDYQITPENAAKIIGADMVNAGESLYFAVEPESGYTLNSVYVDGIVMEAVNSDSFADDVKVQWRGYPYVYMIDNAVENLDIVIELEEVMPVIPDKIYTAETEDAVFTVKVPDGAFKEEVELHVSKIENKEQLDELAEQANEAIKSNKAVAGIMAYDISFVSAENGTEIEPEKAVNVGIRFKKEIKTEEAKDKEVKEISVIHLPEDNKAEVVVSTENVKDKKFEFQTDGFSIFVVTELAEAATIYNGEPCSTLGEAIQKVNNDEEENIIYLTSDIAENIVSEGKNYMLDMKGYTIQSASNEKYVYEIKGGNITIKNGTITGGGSGSKKGLYVTNNADITLNNVAVTSHTSNNSGGGIYANNSTVILENSLVAKNTNNGSGGGGIDARNSNLTIIGSEITENAAKSSAGGICASDCNVVIKNNEKTTKITKNIGLEQADAIYINKGNLTITGKENNYVEISDNNVNNKTQFSIFLLHCSSSLMKYVRFSNNNAGLKTMNRKGSVADEKNADVTLENVDFTKQRQGASIYVDNACGIFTASNCKFDGNDVTSNASEHQAMIYLKNTCEKTLTNCQFYNNTLNSSTYGVLNIYCIDRIFVGEEDLQTVNINECNFVGNKGGKSGAIYYQGFTYDKNRNKKGVPAIVNIDKCLFSENTGTDAGAIYCTDYSKFIRGEEKAGRINVSETVITNNTCTNSSKGAVNIDRGIFLMNSGAVYGNYNTSSNTSVPGDIKLGASATYLNVQILAAETMQDKDVNFKGYIWKSGTEERPEELKSSYSGTTSKVWYAFRAKKPGVAQIGETEYPSLKEAISKAKDGDTIKLIVKQVPADENISIDKNITIEMNNATIDNGEHLRYIYVRPGKKLMLSGNGTITHYIEVADSANLEITGNVQVLFPVTSYGNVTVKSQLDRLQVELKNGKFELEEGASVSRLTISENHTSGMKQSAVINGSVENLTLEQSGNDTEAIINAEIGTLILKQSVNDAETGEPIVRAGENFSAEKMELTPALGGKNPELSDVVSPTKEIPDILMIHGPVDKEKINLENAVWKYPNSSDGNSIYNFLIKVALDEKGNIILNKSISDGIYLGGSNGNDAEGNGLRADSPVATFKRAKELLNQLQNPEEQKIFIVGPVSIKGNTSETWSLEQGMVQRYPLHTGKLIDVEQNAVLTLENITIDGSMDAGSNLKVTSPIIMNNGTLYIKDGACLQNNHNTYRDVNYEGGAVNNQGTLEMTGGIIQKNSAVSGGGVFNYGTFNLSGGEIRNNVATGTHKSSGLSEATGSAGGGVFIAGSIGHGGGKNGVMNFTGGKISNNTSGVGIYEQDAIGGGIALGNGSNVYIGGTLNMYAGVDGGSGTIEGNTALSNGGGIYVQQGCKAYISAGKIIGNHSEADAYSQPFGGGGIYVNGGKDPKYANGFLQLTNVKISNNRANSSGGGIAACPSATVEIFLDEGGLIYQNKSSLGNSIMNQSEGVDFQKWD